MFKSQSDFLGPFIATSYAFRGELSGLSLRRAAYCRHLLDSNLICYAATLDKLFFVRVDLCAKLIDALMFVQQLQLFKVHVALLKLFTFLCVLHDETLVFLFDFKVS